MELDSLYDLTSKEKIKVYNYRFKNINGICMKYNSCCYIGLNYRKFINSKQEKCVLAEEIGHYYYEATYPISADKTFINKQEYKAKKWSYNALIPYEDLKLAILKR